MNYYIGVWKKFAEFSGRAGRAEYWWFFLVNLLIVTALSMLDAGLAMAMGADTATFSILVPIYSLAVLIPALAVTVRRLHDTNHSGWWVLLSLIPLIGPLVLLIFLILPGDSGANQFGSNPAGDSAVEREPTQPTQSKETVQPEKATEQYATQPAETAKPTQPSEPAEPEEPTQPSGPERQ
jgi:uncharacterized membrane protein YhaH (DUF805 family)